MGDVLPPYTLGSLWNATDELVGPADGVYVAGIACSPVAPAAAAGN